MITVPLSPGELLDKITILEIKAERIQDPAKRRNVARELALLREVRAAHVPASAELAALVTELRGVNAQLWDIEDRIRACERQGDFGADFVQLARAVYRTNDARSAVKRRINTLLDSPIVEEKSYADY
ncbi:MAG: hypothetical protein H6739_42385 [Alphaproteobacteria bacterium]|nr:hypothetical protein [Alphaproteobacteria bacterium]